MRVLVPALGAGLLVLAVGLAVSGRAAPDGGAALKPVAAFETIADPAARSAALFEEAAKVFLHPRCVNCHPRGDSPTQGDQMVAHLPMVVRGPDGFGVAGMRCGTCHMEDNVELGDGRSIPGVEGWHLARAGQAWAGASAGEVCAQLKDPTRSGLTLAEIVEHNAHDHLVGWAWHPGSGRSTPPGDQASFGALVRAWVETGAHCPA